jgi:hypothetical protein
MDYYILDNALCLELMKSSELDIVNFMMTVIISLL